MLKIMNPNYIAPVDAKAGVVKAKLAAYFAANPDVPYVTLEQVLARFPGDSAGMVVGALHQVARDAGWTVQASGE